MPLSTKEISVTEATAGGENRLLWMSATRGVTPAITGRILNGWNMRVRRIQPGGRPYPEKSARPAAKGPNNRRGAKGGASALVAEGLHRPECSAVNLRGGMETWGNDS